MLVLPVFVIVSVFVEDVPVFTFPNAKLVPLKESVWATATPVPVSATVEGEAGALLAMLTLPAKLPTVVGANTALNVAVPLGATLVVLRPFTEYPTAPMLTCEMASVVVPVFVIVKVWDFVWPSITLPKLKLAGLTDNPACAPVPLSAIVAGEPEALLVRLTLPLAAPAAVGANTTLNVRVWDGFSVAGTLTPLNV
jgi:hypothetical protein